MEPLSWAERSEVGRGISADSLVGQYDCLESNASDYREVAEEGGYVGEFW